MCAFVDVVLGLTEGVMVRICRCRTTSIECNGEALISGSPSSSVQGDQAAVRRREPRMCGRCDCASRRPRERLARDERRQRQEPCAQQIDSRSLLSPSHRGICRAPKPPDEQQPNKVGNEVGKLITTRVTMK
jgi:hypothetical protein